MKANVTAQAFDRKTMIRIGKPRKEVVNLSNNELFKGCKTVEEVTYMYEDFWNRLNLKSKEVVVVLSVQIIKTKTK